MKRTLLLATAWLVAAAAAVGVGFLAVSLVDASASPGARPGLPAASTAAESATSSATTPSGERATAGGTVYASCVDGTARLAGAPASGWAVESTPGQVEFRDGSQKIEVRADCSTGSPQFVVAGPRADGGGRDDAPAPTTASTTPSTGADDHGGDDRGGDHGGGHGSDD